MLLPPHLFCVFRYIRPRAAYAACKEAGKTARAACFSRAAPLVYPHPPVCAASCFIVIARASSFFLALPRMSRTLEIKGKAALVAFPFTLPLRPHPPVCAVRLFRHPSRAFVFLRLAPHGLSVQKRGIAVSIATSYLPPFRTCRFSVFVAFPFTLPLRPHPPVCAACLSARTLPAFALLRRSARVGGRGIAEKSAKSGDVLF